MRSPRGSEMNRSAHRVRLVFLAIIASLGGNEKREKLGGMEE